MTRRSIGRAAVKLYPANVRDARGEELLGTLLDAGDASLGEFLAQLASLVASGLAARSRHALAAPIGMILSQIVCWAAIAILTRVLSVALASGLRYGDWLAAPFTPLATLVLLPALALALFTAGRAILTGLIGLAWCVWSYQHAAHYQALRILLEVAPAAIGFMVMAITPRRAPKSGRSLWLVPAGVTVLVVLTSGYAALVVGTGWLLPALAALLLLPIQPTFALGTALAAFVWASQAILASQAIQYGGQLYGDQVLTLTITLAAITTLAVLILIGLARRAITHR